MKLVFFPFTFGIETRRRESEGVMIFSLSPLRWIEVEDK